MLVWMPHQDREGQAEARREAGPHVHDCSLHVLARHLMNRREII